MASPTNGGLVERPCCPACRQEVGELLTSIPYDEDPVRSYLERFYDGRLLTGCLAGERYEVLSCPACGLVYQRMAPDAALLDHLYGEAAYADPDVTGRARGLSTRVAYAHDVEQMLRHFARSPDEIEVLDFGSGTGLWLAMAAAFGCRTTGAELTSAGLERVATAGHRALALADVPTERFDYVNTEQVVEHLVDPLQVLERLAGALRPGGVLRVSVPNGSDIRERLALGDWRAPKGSPHSMNAVAPLEHLNCFTPDSLQTLGLRVGLQPFHYPLRTELHPLGRPRFMAGALRARVRPSRGTLQLFSRGR